ncbi:unnamed protein product [Chrysoparadoxa australica]
MCCSVELAPSALMDHFHSLTEGLQGLEDTGHFALVDQINGNAVKRLMVKHKVMFRATQGSRALADRVNAAIDRTKVESEEVSAGVAIVPVDAVDSIIRAHYSQARVAYTIYLLNTNTNTTKEGKYAYRTEGAAAQQTIGWVGKEGERYAWLDLSAGPLSWGPNCRANNFRALALSSPCHARGVVTEETMPDFEAAVKRGDDNVLYSKIAALVYRSLTLLMTRPLLLEPGGMGSEKDIREENAVLQLLVICDSKDACPGTDVWMPLERQLKDMASPALTLEREVIRLNDSPLLLVALQQAMREEHVIDSEVLREWLTKYWRRKKRPRGGGRAVPLFIFHLTSEEDMTLDGKSVSAAFPDMAITLLSSPKQGGVLNSSSESWLQGYRATLAAAAQVLWGVPPRPLLWDDLRLAADTDFLWSTGATVHLPLSAHTGLTYVEKDAFARTKVLRGLDAVMRKAENLISEFNSLSAARALRASEQAVLNRSWEGVNLAMDRAGRSWALLEFSHVADTTREIEDQLDSIRDLMLDARGRVDWVRPCALEETIKAGMLSAPSLARTCSIYLYIVAAFCCLAAAWRRSRKQSSKLKHH